MQRLPQGRLSVFTVFSSVVGAVVAVGIAVGSVAFVGFGADSVIEVVSAVALTSASPRKALYLKSFQVRSGCTS